MTSDARPATRGIWALIALFLSSGVLHFARPQTFEAIVPRWLPGHRRLVHLSGAAEIVCAAGLALPSTRRPAGLASAALLTLVFPANVQMAYDVSRRGSMPATAAALARLPLQLPMIRCALRAAGGLRGAGPSSAQLSGVGLSGVGLSGVGLSGAGSDRAGL